MIPLSSITKYYLVVLLSILSMNLTSTDNFSEFLVKEAFLRFVKKGRLCNFSLECVLVIFFEVSRIAHYVINTSLVVFFFLVLLLCNH